MEKFVHSIKVPIQYKKAAKFLKNSLSEGASLKGQIFEDKHVRTDKLYALMSKVSKFKNELDQVIERSEILVKEPRLDRHLCLVLVTELLFGAKKLNGDSKPVVCVRSYGDKLQEILTQLQNENDGRTDGRITTKSEEYFKPRYVRVNTNIISRSDALEEFLKDGWQEKKLDDISTYDEFLMTVRNLGDFDFISDMHVKNLFVFPASSKRFWAGHKLVIESKVILQDKASCIPAMFLSPKKNSTVFDMCAAPGMKTTHIASLMKNKGIIYASEQHERRFQTLKDLLATTKCTIAKPLLRDALTIYDSDVPNARYILVDPSCSGSGMINRLFVPEENNNEDRLYALAGLQIKMLSHALLNFPMATRVVYSTCSIYPEENEEVVKRCLELCPEWELKKPLEFAEKWKNFGSSKYKHVGKKCIYARSDIDFTDGFFVAVFEREQRTIDGDDPIESDSIKCKKSKNRDLSESRSTKKHKIS